MIGRIARRGTASEMPGRRGPGTGPFAYPRPLDQRSLRYSELSVLFVKRQCKSPSKDDPRWHWVIGLLLIVIPAYHSLKREGWLPDTGAGLPFPAKTINVHAEEDTVYLSGTAHTPHERQIEAARSEEHTSELQSLMRISYAVFCLKKK